MSIKINAVIHPRFRNTLPMIELRKDYNQHSMEQMFIYRWLNVDTSWMGDPIDYSVEEMDVEEVVNGWYYATFEHEKPSGFDYGDYDTVATLHNMSTIRFKKSEHEQDT